MVELELLERRERAVALLGEREPVGVSRLEDSILRQAPERQRRNIMAPSAKV